MVMRRIRHKRETIDANSAEPIAVLSRLALRGPAISAVISCLHPVHRPARRQRATRTKGCAVALTTVNVPARSVGNQASVTINGSRVLRSRRTRKMCSISLPRTGAERVTDCRWRRSVVVLHHVDRGLELRLPQTVHVRADRRRLIGAVALTHERSDTLASFDVALLGEVGQCPTHRNAGHPELVAKGLLGGQRIAGSDRAAGDLVVQHQEQLTMQRHSGAARHRADAAPVSCMRTNVFTPHLPESKLFVMSI